MGKQKGRKGRKKENEKKRKGKAYLLDELDSGLSANFVEHVLEVLLVDIDWNTKDKDLTGTLDGFVLVLLLLGILTGLLGGTRGILELLLAIWALLVALTLLGEGLLRKGGFSLTLLLRLLDLLLSLSDDLTEVLLAGILVWALLLDTEVDGEVTA